MSGNSNFISKSKLTSRVRLWWPVPYGSVESPTRLSRLELIGSLVEEVRNATVVVPWCMVLTIVLNGALGFAMIIAFLFTIGNMQLALKNPTGYDFLYIFESATRSKAGAIAMSSVLITMGMCATIGIIASASRQTWAFARDGGLPFSRSLSKVRL